MFADKILINKGNVVAEYVPSEDSYSVSTKSEWSERFDDVVNEAKSKAKRPEFGNRCFVNENFPNLNFNIHTNAEKSSRLVD